MASHGEHGQHVDGVVGNDFDKRAPEFPLVSETIRLYCTIQQEDIRIRPSVVLHS
jgi:hypothetical protein